MTYCFRINSEIIRSPMVQSVEQEASNCEQKVASLLFNLYFSWKPSAVFPGIKLHNDHPPWLASAIICFLWGGGWVLISGKSKWGFSNGGLRPFSATCAQSSIVRFCGPFGPLSKGNFRHEMTTIVDNRGTIVDKYVKPPFPKPPFRLSR